MRGKTSHTIVIDDFSFPKQLFGDVPQKGSMPFEPIVRAADFDETRKYRWTAIRRWGAGGVILWAMLNPSLADGKQDDPTMQRVIGFSYRWGYGAAIVVNLHPLVSPNPHRLDEWRHSREVDIVRMINIGKVQAAIADARTCVAAWGAYADPEDVDWFVKNATKAIPYDEETGDPPVDVPVDWHCIGTTVNGSPKHPLARGRSRVPDDATLQLWRKAYG